MPTQMPETGRNWTDLKQEMIDRGGSDARWREGRTAVYVFNAGEDVARVQKEAYTLYMSENGLGPLAFPSLKQMEDEVIGMGLGLLHGPADAADLRRHRLDQHGGQGSQGLCQGKGRTDRYTQYRHALVSASGFRQGLHHDEP